MTVSWVPLAKTLGSVLVIGAGGIAGFAFAGRLEERLREFQRLEAALLHLSTEISYSLTPLPEALTKAGERAGGATGVLFSRFGSLTGLSQRRTAQEALAEAMVECGAQVAPSSKDLLDELALYLGTSGHKEQARYIEMSIDKAKRQREEFEADCRKRAKLYRYLGLLGGACVAIVLL